MLKTLRFILPIILGVIIVDQATKLLILAFLKVHQSIAILPFFNLVLVYNKGVSFGLFQSQGMLGRWLLLSIASGVCMWLLVLIFQTKQKFERVCYSLIVGGAVGNIIDRFCYGGVVDFLDFHIGARHWPAFNIADSAIVVGVGLILVVQTWHSLKQRK
jgi:signal peptidase II